MAISNQQLETWSQQGKTGLFTETYNSIRNNLLDASAPYPLKNIDVFLQGSYGNDTNVFRDSDVDIVIKLNGAFHYDISALSANEQERFKSAYSKNADYGYPQFKPHVEQWLNRVYDNVDTTRKATLVPGNNNRKSADVLICQQFRRYTSYDFALDNYHEGVSFYFRGNRIENFPKQHSDNCTTKHQATKGNFKRLVRVFKNMRNAMIEQNLLAEGIAPSYFIEGMLSNVPNEKFAGDYRDMWVACFNWLVTADASQLTTGSGLHWLVRDNSNVCWPSANFRAFTTALKKYWEN